MENRFRKLEHINYWISNCDTKSSFVFAFLGVIITIIFTSSIGQDMMSVFNYEFTPNITIESIINFLSLVSVILFIISSLATVILIYITLKGRVDINKFEGENLKRDSNVFCVTIADKTFDEFITDCSGNNLKTDLDSQIYINSHIATKKFRYYNFSLICLIITFISFIAYIIFDFFSISPV